MKKMISLATLLAISSVAIAQTATTETTAAAQATEQTQVFGANHEKEGKRGGFFDESAAVKSVQAAKSAADNTLVMIDGKIIKQIDDDEFLFRDTAGNEIQIEVSRRAWNGLQITLNDTIQIRGKVDKEWNKTELDVKQIIKK